MDSVQGKYLKRDALPLDPVNHGEDCIRLRAPDRRWTNSAQIIEAVLADKESSRGKKGTSSRERDGSENGGHRNAVVNWRESLKK